MILVGNKADLKSDIDQADILAIETEVRRIHNKYTQVEHCVECSCKLMTNTNEVLLYAQKAAYCPLRVVYDAADGKLTKKGTSAFTRIFRLCDRNVDGWWNEEELGAFEQHAYGKRSERADTEKLKDMLRVYQIFSSPVVHNKYLTYNLAQMS